jgi:hypothetical protein
MTSKYHESLVNDFRVAYDIGLDCLDRLAESKVNEEQGLIALVTVVCHAAFSMAPSDQRASHLIEFATDMARRNWADEQAERAES